MTKDNPTAVQLTASILIAGEHFDEGDILIVGNDIELEEAKAMVRLGRAVKSEAKRARIKAKQGGKDVDPAPVDPPPV